MAWLTAIPHCLSGKELSWEEFKDNLLLRYGIMYLNLSTDFDGCENKYLVPHNLSRPKGGLVMAKKMMLLSNGEPFGPEP